MDDALESLTQLMDGASEHMSRMHSAQQRRQPLRGHSTTCEGS